MCINTNMRSQLYAAIKDWHTGVLDPKKFTADVYLDVYNGNKFTLQTIKAQRPGAFHLMMADVYTLARYVSLIYYHDRC